MIRRLFADEAERVESWLMRDEGKESDFTPFLSNPLNVCLAAGDGGAFFIWHGPGVYEVHVAFEQRGKEVIEISHKMLAWMRENMGGTMFWAGVPVEKRHVIIFTRKMGWKSRGLAVLPHSGWCELFTGE